MTEPNMEYGFETIEKLKFKAVRTQVVIPKMIQMIKKAMSEKRTINWDDFFDYCMEYFNLPISTIEECIPVARKWCDL